MYYIYILINTKTGRYYVGYTPDLKNRLTKHKSGQVLSTKSNLNYEFEWYCAFKTKDLALSFERYLKSGSGRAFMSKRFFKKSRRFSEVKSMETCPPKLFNRRSFNEVGWRRWILPPGHLDKLSASTERS